MSAFVSPLEKRGGLRLPLLPQRISDFLYSPEFNKRINKMKVGASIRVPHPMTKHEALILQKRIWRLNKHKTKEFRSFVSKRHTEFFIFRIA